MKNNKIYKYLILIIIGLLPLIIAIFYNNSFEENDKDVNELNEIIKRKKIVALTTYSSDNYFIYKGEPLGFQYEMLKSLANYLDVELEIVVCHDFNEIFEWLEEGKGDIIAMNLTVTNERKKRFDFTHPHTITHQVLVQRKPDKWWTLSKSEIDDKLIRNQVDLIDKTIHTRKESSYYSRLFNLSEEIGGNINIKIVSGDIDDEHLINMVSKGDIDYAVVDYNVAYSNSLILKNIDVNTPISLSQQLAWAVRKNSHNFKDTINLWVDEFIKTKKYKKLQSKYYINKYQNISYNKTPYTINKSKLSGYDKLIKKHSKMINWDWRLLASLIYQESKFNDTVVSWMGAYGLMQVTPETAERFGYDTITSPEENIIAGVKLLRFLQRYWEKRIPDKNEQIKFILASYNVGLGHIIDARHLTEKYDKNPDIWDGNVAFFLKNKAFSKYYNDDVVKHGYCRGSETYGYVIKVLNRYKHFKNVLK